MKLSIYSIQSTIFDGDVKSLTVPTAMGEITILDNHLPLISVVNAGKIRFTHIDNKEEEVSFSGGILEVRPGSEVVILAKEESV